MSSFLRTLWRRIRHPTGFVGRDLEGNSYFEWANPLQSAGYSRPKRSVKYRHSDDMWNYIGGSRRLPIQWSAWLAHTRLHPPTIEELQIDLMRQQRVQRNAALIEASFEQERAQLRLEESAPSQLPAIEEENVSYEPSKTPPPEKRAPTASGSSLPKTGPDDYQPESWTPKLGIRRG